jgi:hypothetical protein
VALPATYVETRETIDFGEHFEEGWCVEAVPLVVVSGPHQLGPHLGVLVPVAAHLLVVHATMLQCFPKTYLAPFPTRSLMPVPRESNTL